MKNTCIRCTLVAGVAIAISFGLTQTSHAEPRKPNIIVIVADDLGYGDLGCFGQQKLRTPRLDAMATQGMRFTQFYAGSSVDAPSRYVLLTGQHTGRAAIRGNQSTNAAPNSPLTPPASSTGGASGTQTVVPPSTSKASGTQTAVPTSTGKASGTQKPNQTTVASLLKTAGYMTACIGVWGIDPQHGSEASEFDNPNAVGFEYFYGYHNRAHADNHYPEFLIRNGKQAPLKNVVGDKWKPWRDDKLPQAGQGVAVEKREYALELLTADALRFIREHAKQPFFLMFAPNVPRANLAAGDQGLEVPDLGEFASQDWPDAEKRYAAMIHNLDHDVGRVLDLVTELKLDQDTLVIFTSDNGPHSDGGHNADFFESNGKYRGGKGDLNEGGIRVPMIARWPGTVPADSENDRQWWAGDLMATAADLSGATVPAGIGSDSLLPALRGTVEKDQWKRKSPLYWELYEGPTSQAVRFGKWKAIRSPMHTGEVQLYDMSNDPDEKRSFAARRVQLADHAKNLFNKHHVPDANWPVPTERPEK